jgi:NADH:ubiquinone oxidoreductase subunit D
MPFKDPEVRRVRQAVYSKTYYEKNQKEVIRKVNAKKKIHKTWFVNYKKQLACVTCGYNHPAALDFHHVEQKKSNRKVHRLVSDGHTKKRILEEIDKCVVLCSNCHRVHHHDERKNKRKIVATSLK